MPSRGWPWLFSPSFLICRAAVAVAAVAVAVVGVSERGRSPADLAVFSFQLLTDSTDDDDDDDDDDDIGAA
jgi:hypothetical protein